MKMQIAQMLAGRGQPQKRNPIAELLMAKMGGGVAKPFSSPATPPAPPLGQLQGEGGGGMFIPPSERDPREDYLREEMGEEEYLRFKRMSPMDQKRYMQDPANGFAPPAAPESDPIEQHGPLGPMELQLDTKGKSFDDSRSYRTAELDAFKMMQLQPDYAAPVKAGDMNSTEGGKLSLLRRMMFADAALEDPRLAKSMTRMDNNIAGKLGALGRYYTDDDYELGRLMAETFSNAVLRNDSGAQAPEPEVQRYTRQFFPQTGETDQQLAAKKALRRETIRSLMQSLSNDDAGPAVQQVIDEINQLRMLADVPDGSLTGGDISEEDKEFLKSLGLN